MLQNKPYAKSGMLWYNVGNEHTHAMRGMAI